MKRGDAPEDGAGSDADLVDVAEADRGLLGEASYGEGRDGVALVRRIVCKNHSARAITRLRSLSA